MYSVPPPLFPHTFFQLNLNTCYRFVYVYPKLNLSYFHRIVPFYYLINFFMFILFEADCFPDCSFTETNTILLTITMTNTCAFLPCIKHLPFPPSVTSWFITTLVPFYLMVPMLLPPLQKCSSQNLYISLVLAVFIFFVDLCIFVALIVVMFLLLS